MYGDLIRMVGFVLATNMASVAGAGLAGGVAAPKVVDEGANALEVVPT